jgi:hypothetical protein
MRFVQKATQEALAAASGVLHEAASAWKGHYESPEVTPNSSRAYCTGPCGRVDATVDGVEIIVRVLPSPVGMLFRAYAGMPHGERVSLERRRTLHWLLPRMGPARRTGDALLDQTFVMRASRQSTLVAFLGDSMRDALHELMGNVVIDELSDRCGAVTLRVGGLALDLASLDAAAQVVVAAGRFRLPAAAYR